MDLHKSIQLTKKTDVLHITGDSIKGEARTNRTAIGQMLEGSLIPCHPLEQGVMIFYARQQFMNLFQGPQNCNKDSLFSTTFYQLTFKVPTLRIITSLETVENLFPP